MMCDARNYICQGKRMHMQNTNNLHVHTKKLRVTHNMQLTFGWCVPYSEIFPNNFNLIGISPKKVFVSMYLSLRMWNEF